MIAKPYMGYWGKAQQKDDQSPRFHRLPYHCLDVAAVAITLLRKSPNLGQFIAQALKIESDQTLQDWFGFVAAFHDLGKFAESFQGQRPDLVQHLQDRNPDPGKPYTVRHDSLGWLLWDQQLKDLAADENWFGPDTEVMLDGAGWWFRASMGHHGLPPDANAGYWIHHFARDDLVAVHAFAAELQTLFPVREFCSSQSSSGEAEFESTSKILSWWIAGITVLSDWLGSNTLFFPYLEEEVALDDYWHRTLAQAEVALHDVGILPLPHRNCGFSELFPDITTPSPLQDFAINTPIAPLPQMHLLEDVTGAGKTEAAVMLAHRMIGAGVADGFFIALPTMATANAMYDRVAEVYRQLFEGHPSLVLAHGQRNLVENFADSVLPVGRAEGDPLQSDETATAYCNGWLADHNKRALLAPAGVGTIDQVLLGTLYSKHQSLRLLGLFRKVLIVDEVHACDAYMQRVLETVLTFHAMAGGSVILLSATLPEHMKQSLFAAFARGRGVGAPPATTSPEFPLVTSWNEGQNSVTLMPVMTREVVCRELAIRYVADEQEVLFAIRSALAKDQCVCWIRNTVADVLNAQALFTHELDAEHLIVFHARFALEDRLATEQKILTHFGKASSPLQRAGRLVIASQVAEQSLDADWDFMISDLAPIDRLLQRAGRLQRHPRNVDGARLADPEASDQRGQPCLWVHGPVWTESPAANWFKAAFQKAAAVYPHHGHLWLTARVLQRGHIAIPGEARTLIETVFGEESPLPTSLDANANRATGAYFSDLSVAQQNTIKVGEGYVRGGMDWWSEAKTPTRLGEPSSTVLLACWDGDRLRPWSGHNNPGHAWAYSTVKMAQRLISSRAPERDPARENSIRDAEEFLPDRGKWSVVLALQNTSEGWTGKALAVPRDGKPIPLRDWRYSRQRGLEQKESAEHLEQEFE